MAAVGGTPRAGDPIGEGEQMNGFILTDAAIERALAPGADVVAPADFTDRVVKAIAHQAPRSRFWLLNPITWPSAPRLTRLILVLLLLLVLVVGALGVASLLRRSFANGEVIVASATELLAIDPQTGVTRSL